MRVLTLDGGGIRGVYTAAALAEIESRTGKRTVEHFDLLVGTSTGGIIALALAAGRTAAEILKLYTEQGSAIFPSAGVRKPIGRLKRLFKAKYSQESLRQVLAPVFEDKLLGDLDSRVVATAYSATRNDLHCFRNYAPPGSEGHSALPAVLVAQATAAAPTYFGAVQIPDELPDPGIYLDGGICSNSPVLVGVVEAFAHLRAELSTMRVLSIGTLYEKFREGEKKQGGGIVQWGKSALELLMHGQQAAGVTLAESMLDQDRFVRVTRQTEQALSLDDVSEVDTLKKWGSAAVHERHPRHPETYLERIERIFFQSKARGRRSAPRAPTRSAN